jgi:hypothetical protein
MIRVIIYIAAFICIAVYLWLNKNKNTTTSTSASLKNIKMSSETPSGDKCINPYITPQPYNTGYIQEPQSLANACGADVMYPIQPPYVKYGKWKNGGDCCSGSCDNLIFNAPP